MGRARLPVRSGSKSSGSAAIRKESLPPCEERKRFLATVARRATTALYDRRMAGRGTARTLIAGLAMVLSILAGGGTASAAAADPPCTAWNTRTVASNLGVLENLEPDGGGGMLLSVNDA